MNKDLSNVCEEVVNVGDELFCTRTWKNLTIDPCSWDCVKYQQRLYDNIDNLAYEVVQDD